MADIHIGTCALTASGWKGVFYPKGMKAGDYLRFYSERFDTVEMDSTFYGCRVPTTGQPLRLARQSAMLPAFCLPPPKGDYSVMWAVGLPSFAIGPALETTMKPLVRQGKFVLHFGFVVLGFLMVLGAVRNARADETYTFVGQPFQGDFLDSDCYPACRIKGSFTVAQPLAANSFIRLFAPESFSFTDGFYTYTQLTADSAFYDFSINSFGAITQWAISMDELEPPTANPFSPTSSGLMTTYSTEFGEGDSSSTSNIFGLEGFSQSLGFTGKWTAAPVNGAVPEPGSAVLVGVGFGLMMLLAVGKRG